MLFVVKVCFLSEDWMSLSFCSMAWSLRGDVVEMLIYRSNDSLHAGYSILK
jgi:hypothetical protein